MTLKRVLKAGTAVFLLTAVEATFPAYAALDELVVTARKREESLQDVPFSISAFGVEGLRERNIQNIYDLSTFTPNFQLTRNIGRRLDAINVRGQFSPLLGQSNASVFVDGVFVTGTSSNITIDNLERVEVLRGPQAALFGRATFSGAINFITKEPSNEFEGEVNLKAGNEEDYKASVWASGPIVEDKLLFFASANWESFGGEWRNGLVDGVNPVDDFFDGLDPAPFDWLDYPRGADNTKLGGEETFDLTGKLSFRPTENLEINFKTSYTETEDDHFASLLVPTSDLNCFLPGEPGSGPVTEGWICGEVDPDGLVTQVNIPNLREGVSADGFITGDIAAGPAPFIGARSQIHRYLGEVKWDIEEWEAIGRATYNISRSEFYKDLDRSPAMGPAGVGLFENGEREKIKDWSYEAKLISPQENRVRGLIGAYSFRNTFRRGQSNYVGFGGPTTIEEADRADVKNTALFGSLEFDLNDQWTVSYDARYAEDNITRTAGFDGSQFEENFYSFSPRYTVTYKPQDEYTFYALAAKGNKPGGFNGAYFEADVEPDVTLANLVNGNAVIEEEEAWTYEIGAKTSFLDGRLVVNGALYFIDWANQAINQIDCVDISGPLCEDNNIIVNAGKSEVKGAELEVFYDATDNLSLTFTYGLSDTELLEFNDGDIAQLTGIDDPFLLNGGNAKGKEAPRVPKHSINLAGTYNNVIPNSDLGWFVRSDLTYESKRWVTPANFAHTGELYLWNARAGIEADAWTLSAYVDNILDDDTPLQIQDFPNFGEAVGSTSAFDYLATDTVYFTGFQISPRRSTSFGVTAQYRF